MPKRDKPMTTAKNLPRPSADEIYTQALEQLGFDNPPPAILRLLSQGLKALRAWEHEPINKVERKALSAMIAYVAHTQKVSEPVVGGTLCAYYSIPEVKALPSCLYQNAVEFLIDLEMKKILN